MLLGQNLGILRYVILDFIALCYASAVCAIAYSVCLCKSLNQSVFNLSYSMPDRPVVASFLTPNVALNFQHANAH